MVPPWHDCRLKFTNGNGVQLASSTIAPTLPGERELFFHPPWAYGVAVNGASQGLLAAMLVPSELRQTAVHIGCINPEGKVDRIGPCDSWAALYRELRYERVVHAADEFASVAYHVEDDLEAAIAL
jgi:hypothetical protein